MRLLSKILLAIGLIVGARVAASSQTLVQEQSVATIKGFLYDLYQTNQSALVIAKQYILLQDGANELSTTARYQLAAEHLTQLRQNAAADGVNSVNDYEVLPYNKLGDKVENALTGEERKMLYVLIKDKSPVRYFVVKDKKIISFYYFEKGSDGPAYFLSY